MIKELVVLVCLSPFYDKTIRLKSGVSNREDTDNYRFPIILPARHPVVGPILRHAQKVMPC